MAEETKDTAPQAEPQEREEAPAQEAEQTAPEKSEAELLREQVDSLNDKLLRTMAEYDNFRKRSVREKEAIYPQATAAAVAQFLPVVDTIERALAAPCTDAEFKKGVEMILQNFKDVFAKLGVEEFGAAGDKFDPQLHNAVMHVEDESLGENMVSQVFQAGFMLGEKVIRHAIVQVAN